MIMSLYRRLGVILKDCVLDGNGRLVLHKTFLQAANKALVDIAPAPPLPRAKLDILCRPDAHGFSDAACVVELFTKRGILVNVHTADIELHRAHLLLRAQSQPPHAVSPAAEQEQRASAAAPMHCGAVSRVAAELERGASHVAPPVQCGAVPPATELEQAASEVALAPVSDVSVATEPEQLGQGPSEVAPAMGPMHCEAICLAQPDLAAGTLARRPRTGTDPKVVRRLR